MRRFRHLLESIPDAVVIVDSRGTIRLANRQAEKLFAYRHGELLGRPLENLMPERLRAAHAQHRATYSDRPRARPMGAGQELVGCRRDGTEFPVDISLSPMKSGGKSWVIAAVRDVSGRKRAEEALRRRVMQQELISILGQRALGDEPVSRLMDAAATLAAKGLEVEFALPWGAFYAQASKIQTLTPEDAHFLQAMANIVALAIERDARNTELQCDLQLSKTRLEEAQTIAEMGTWDLTGDQVTWSDEMYRIHGFDGDTCPPTYDRFLNAIHEEDRRIFKENVVGGLETGKPFLVRYRVRKPDGTLRWIEGRGQAVRAPATSHRRVAGIAFDVTAQQKIEEADKRREQQQRDFVANVSHEFRTPLTAIRGFAETLRKGGLKDHKNATRFLAIIERHAQRLSRIVNDLLELSAQEAGLPLEMETLELKPAVDRLCESLAPLAAKKDVSLRNEAPAGLAVEADEARLAQILQNLISNAIKHNRSGGSVRIVAEAQETEIVVSVSDTGEGIAPEHLSELFKRFQRAHTRTDRSNSTGLGLAICKGLIEAHGGRIWVESALGEGSTFSFSLPAFPKRRSASSSSTCSKVS